MLHPVHNIGATLLDGVTGSKIPCIGTSLDSIRHPFDQSGNPLRQIVLTRERTGNPQQIIPCRQQRKLFGDSVLRKNQTFLIIVIRTQHRIVKTIVPESIAIILQQLDPTYGYFLRKSSPATLRIQFADPLPALCSVKRVIIQFRIITHNISQLISYTAQYIQLLSWIGIFQITV